MWEQNETGSEREFPEHVGPAVFGWFRGRGDDPKLSAGMVDDGDGVALGGADGPTPSEEVDLVIGVEAAREMEGEVEIEEAGIGAGTHGVASIVDGLVPSVVGGKARGPANGAV